MLPSAATPTPTHTPDDVDAPASVVLRRHRHDRLELKRRTAAQVAAFHDACWFKARRLQDVATRLPTPQADPGGLIDQIFDACNCELGAVLYINATSTPHQKRFETYFHDGDEEHVRTMMTQQQTREDHVHHVLTGVESAQHVLTSFRAWTAKLRASKRRRKTVAQCHALAGAFKTWTAGLYWLTRGSRRLRFLAAARRREQRGEEDDFLYARSLDV